MRENSRDRPVELPRGHLEACSRQLDRAPLLQQEPDRIISWENVSGPANRGIVSFRPIGTDRTEVSLHLEFEPEGMAEQAGDKLGIVSGRAKGDLERFKEFIEERGSETGGWRGEVDSGVKRR